MLLLLIIMAEVWGNLAKAQDDPETIEQAIARLVAEHNGEPVAHTEAGQAIALHRENGTLDHPQGAVLADKLSARDVDISFNFQSLTGLTASAGVTADNLKAKLVVQSGVRDSAWLEVYPFNLSQFPIQKSSILFEGFVRHTTPTAAYSTLSFSRLEFRIEKDRVRGKTWFNASETDYFTDWYYIDMTKLRKLRAVYFVQEGVSRFYVDGDLIGEIADTWAITGDDMQFYFSHNRNGATTSTANLLGARFALFEFTP
jgi:hypothetical protein